MRKIKIMEHVSLDGVMQHHADEGFTHGEWTPPYRTLTGLAATTEAQGESFALLLGRRTYDLWSAYWPTAGYSPVANGINAATKYVATHRPDSLAWGPAQDLGADIIEGICAVKATDGPDLIVWGSSTLTSVLLAHGLVDEVILLVYWSTRSCWVGANASFQILPTPSNSRLSGRRARPRGYSSTPTATWERCSPKHWLLTGTLPVAWQATWRLRPYPIKKPRGDEAF